MDFRLTAFGLACRLSRAAEARVLESEQTPLHYTNGTAVCLVARDPGDTLILKAGRHTLRVVQSTFRVKFHPRGQSIAVVRGAMRLKAAPPSGDSATGQPGASPILLKPGGEADCSETTGCLGRTAQLAKWPSEQADAVERFTEDLERLQTERGIDDSIPSTSDDTTSAATEQATTPNGFTEESEVADPEPTTPDGDGNEQHGGTADEDEEPVAPGSE